MKKTIASILLATIWISISEFVRNQFILKSDWVNHYQSLGLTFPSQPINGAMWGVWSLLFAISIYIVSRKFGLIETTALAWLFGFLMMWIVLNNLGVLPLAILAYAVPLSILEAFIATLIVRKFSMPQKAA